jgi:hypothetical protein
MCYEVYNYASCLRKQLRALNKMHEVEVVA